MGHSMLSISELQNAARSGDDDALTELGRRALHLDINESGHDHLCEYRSELERLEAEVTREIPRTCPHCDRLLDAEPADYKDAEESDAVGAPAENSTLWRRPCEADRREGVTFWARAKFESSPFVVVWNAEHKNWELSPARGTLILVSHIADKE